MLNKRRNDKDEYTRKHPLTHILYALKRLQTNNMYIYTKCLNIELGN